MPNQATLIRFRYRKRGGVAVSETHDFHSDLDDHAVGDVWKEEQGGRVWVSLVVQGSAEEAEEDLAELQKRSDDWLGKHGLKVIADEKD